MSLWKQRLQCLRPSPRSKSQRTNPPSPEKRPKNQPPNKPRHGASTDRNHPLYELPKARAAFGRSFDLKKPNSNRRGYFDLEGFIRPILPRRHPKPAAASLVKTAVVMKTKEIRHMLHVEMRMAQIEVGQLPAHRVLHVLELRPVFFQRSLQCALTDIQLPSDRLHIPLPLALAQPLGNQRPNPADNRETKQQVQLRFGK